MGGISAIRSVERIGHWGGTYSSALRIRSATTSGGFTAVVVWLTTPMQIFLSVRYLPRSGRSRPPVEAHSSVITSALVWTRWGRARS